MSASLRSVLGQSIRARRAELQMTQQVLAQRVGVSQSCIANIEAGRRAADLDILARIAAALRTTASALLSADPTFGGATRDAEATSR